MCRFGGGEGVALDAGDGAGVQATALAMSSIPVISSPKERMLCPLAGLWL